MTGKVVRDGHVAVIYSDGFGTGWHQREYPEALFAPDIVALIEAGAGASAIAEKAESLFGRDFCTLAVKHLAIRWIPVGAKFRIDDYDGAETVILESEEEWITA